MKKRNIDDYSIEELEQDFWPTPESFPSNLVERVFKARKIKIREMKVDEIRVMISQDGGLKYLIPKAINLLEKNILEEAIYYPGDLLMAVLGADENYWKEHGFERNCFVKLIERSIDSIKSNTEIYDEEIVKTILLKIDKFCLQSF